MILEVTAFLIVGLIVYKLIVKEEEIEDCMIFEGKRKVNYFKVNNVKSDGKSNTRKRARFAS